MLLLYVAYSLKTDFFFLCIWDIVGYMGDTNCITQLKLFKDMPFLFNFPRHWAFNKFITVP